jgi:hypothetical protein
LLKQGFLGFLNFCHFVMWKMWTLKTPLSQEGCSIWDWIIFGSSHQVIPYWQSQMPTNFILFYSSVREKIEIREFLLLPRNVIQGVTDRHKINRWNLETQELGYPRGGKTDVLGTRKGDLIPQVWKSGSQ